MGAAFTTISLARSYVLRRLFNAAWWEVGTSAEER
jgi:hypothetical protein